MCWDKSTIIIERKYNVKLLIIIIVMKRREREIKLKMIHRKVLDLGKALLNNSQTIRQHYSHPENTALYLSSWIQSTVTLSQPKPGHLGRQMKEFSCMSRKRYDDWNKNQLYTLATVLQVSQVPMLTGSRSIPVMLVLMFVDICAFKVRPIILHFSSFCFFLVLVIIN